MQRATDQWMVLKHGSARASGLFRTRQEAIDRAEEIVSKAAKGGIVRVQDISDEASGEPWQ